MAEINKDVVKYVAALARLSFDEQELDDFTIKFKNILEYVEQLGTLNVDNIEPTYHVMPIRDTMRADSVENSLSVEKVLRNAPERKSDFFKVPRVVE
jgi:aspartyl-tRNA(Asn)/glutamyl-tRNA(Gln) amidotransferase subunit C